MLRVMSHIIVSPKDLPSYSLSYVDRYWSFTRSSIIFDCDCHAFLPDTVLLSLVTTFTFMLFVVLYPGSHIGPP